MRVEVKLVFQHPPSGEDGQSENRQNRERNCDEEGLQRLDELDIAKRNVMPIIDEIQVNLIGEGRSRNNPREVKIVGKVIDKRPFSFLLPPFLLEPLGEVGQFGDQQHDVDRAIDPPNTVNVSLSPKHYINR